VTEEEFERSVQHDGEVSSISGSDSDSEDDADTARLGSHAATSTSQRSAEAIFVSGNTSYRCSVSKQTALLQWLSLLPSSLVDTSQGMGCFLQESKSSKYGEPCCTLISATGNQTRHCWQTGCSP
jgi:hypothetical protein